MTFYTFANSAPGTTTYINDSTGLPGTPGPDDVIVFDGLTPNPLMSQLTGGYHGMGGFLTMPGASVTLNSDYPSSGAGPANIWLLPGSTLGCGNNLGIISTPTMTIMQGATFNAGHLQGAAPLPFQPFHYSIGSVWNEYGNLVDLSNGELTIGTPNGFLQTGGFLPSESNVSDGAGNNWIMLGDIAQGTNVAPLIESIWNQTGADQSGYFVSSGGEGFVPTMQGGYTAANSPVHGTTSNTTTAGSIAVDTMQLGSHSEALGFVVDGRIVDNLFISDRIV